MKANKSIRWSSELRTTFNEKTGKTFYYIKIGGIFTRVSKVAYQSRDSDSINSSCFLTSFNGSKVTQTKFIHGLHTVAA